MAPAIPTSPAKKSVNPDSYYDGTDRGDDQSWDTSFCFDAVRWSGDRYRPPNDSTYIGMASESLRPRRDISGVANWLIFGSAHANSFNMVLCDGSVHAISYSIDPETHHRLGNKADGKPVDAKAF